MASAVLANRNNEPSWPASKRNGGGGGEFMARVPFSNPKSKPNLKKRQINGEINNFQMGELANVSTLSPSDDASFIDRQRGSSNTGEYNQYVSFSVASCSGKDLVELKRRLVAELEQVRRIKNRIESGGIGLGRNHHLKKSSKTKGIKRARPQLQPPTFGTLDSSDVGNLMKTCSQILNKLMKQKFGMIFNKPVDVIGLGLHDYYDIVKHPMDLGTVKSKLAKNSYESPLDFADDVRLTFNNAMIYNPKGHDIHILAEQWLGKFEELFRPVSEKLDGLKQQPDLFEEELQASSWNDIEMEKKQDSKENFNSNGDNKSEEVRVPSSSSKPPSIQSPVRTPSPVRAPLVKPVRQPKPKAKDPNKREMSLEEKHRLGVGLQGLPPEKMDQVIQIVKRRSGQLRQDGDEIELDIEAVDTETLWELDRLVTNWKKMMSKVKRQPFFNNNANADSSKANETSSANEINEVKTEAKKARKGDVGEEDVDIGDEMMPMGGFPPVVIDRDAAAHASSSSESSSSSGSDDSSSSSDSEGSSSDSDSDGDGQS
ncbi:transcription factor GTE7-like isoform X2 [Momordica charantia]|uniref:Transcription factor GTE7-like isoform X2 n=1 Tax=Momordica charantia TaxID=3673 RepID=A0A6J1C566_MOMCH|nr:transcription factor GTE7-like isoform X2 [Momordica charantia]